MIDYTTWHMEDKWTYEALEQYLRDSKRKQNTNDERDPIIYNPIVF